MFTLLAQITAVPHEFSLPEAVAFVVLTIAFLVVAFFVLWKVHSYETKLILLGLVVAVAATGYGTMVGGGALMAPALTRIGVILVLGGITINLLSYLSGKSAEARAPDLTPPEATRNEP